MICHVCDLGLLEYQQAWDLQNKFAAEIARSERPDTLLLLEHPHTYTFGRRGKPENLLWDEKKLAENGVAVHWVDRGGDVTYHGPGQIVVYPILDLNNYFLDVHRYLRSIEEVIIQTLVKFGISAGREKEMTGVWVQGEKIAAIGVKVSRWVTMHGFALNVNTDLEKFNRIIPCGIFHKGVTSMQKILGQVLPFQSVQEALVYSFANVFGNQPRWIDKEALNAMIQNLNTEEKEKELSQNLATQ